MPAATGALLGRDADCDEVRTALREARLVTLVGPGGMGKSRVAIAVASEVSPELAGGCTYAWLESAHPGRLSEALAAVVGVTERPGQPLDEAIRDRLSHARGLLVLDGCNLVREPAAALVDRLLSGCPELAVLVTAHEPLGVPGEHVVALRPLSTGGDGASSTTVSSAEELFFTGVSDDGADRELDPQLVHELMVSLNGMPLAIEVAARLARDLGLAELRAAVSGTADPMRAVLDLSYAHLDEGERRFMRRLGAFAGEFDLEAATCVGATDDPRPPNELIRRLGRRGLLVRQPPGDCTAERWRMPGVVRGFAREQLAASKDEAGTRRRHLEWASALAAELVRTLAAGRPWRAQFELLIPDLRYALCGRAARTDAGRRLARALGHLCYARQFLHEAGHYFQQAAAEPADRAAAAADLRAAADVAMAQHCGEPALKLLRQSAELARAAGDDAAQAIALAASVCIGSRFPATVAQEVPHHELCRLLEEARRVAPSNDPYVTALMDAAEAWNATGRKTIPDDELAHRALNSALVADDPVLIIAALDAVTTGAVATGRFGDAQRHNEERMKQFERLGRHDPRTGIEVIDTLHVAPLVAVAAGELDSALAAAGRAWSDTFSGLFHRASKQVVPLALSGRIDEALGFAEIMWHAWQRAGEPPARWTAPGVHAAALLYAFRGDAENHELWRGRAVRLAGRRGDGHIAESFVDFADPRIALHAGRIDDALATAVDLSATPPWYEVQHQIFDAYAWAVAAEAAVVAGVPDAAERLHVAAPAAAESAWAEACWLRARGRLHGDNHALRASVAAWDRIGARLERACTMLLLPERARDGLAELRALGCAPPVGPGWPRLR
jgi:predicted ATPase